MASKKKPTMPAIQSKEDLFSMVDDIAKQSVEIRRLEAVRDAAINAVREKHDGQIESLKKVLKATISVAETYAASNRESLFGKAKSAASSLAKFGFREGNQSLCLLNKKWSWEAVLNVLKEKAMPYVRTVEEVDKEGIKTGKLTDVELAAIGCRIDSKERFYVDPKSDDAERINAETEAAA